MPFRISFLSFLLSFVCVPVITIAQTSGESSGKEHILVMDKNFRIGFGLALGVFYPVEINDYIKLQLPDLGAEGEAWELKNNLVVKASFSYFVDKTIELMGQMEAAFASKKIEGSLGTETFRFNRYSPGIVANFHLTVGHRENHSFFFGPGINLNFLQFEEFSAVEMGYGGQAGFSFNTYDALNIHPYFAFYFTEGESKALALDYTSIQYGISIKF